MGKHLVKRLKSRKVKGWEYNKDSKKPFNPFTF